MEIQKINAPVQSHKKYQDFKTTFPHCAFGLAFGLVYPNKFNMRKKVILGCLIILFNFAELFWFVFYLLHCLVKKDIFNITRNVTIGIVVFLFFFKSFYINIKSDMFCKIIEKITEDLLEGNNLSEDFQKVYDFYINEGKFGQTVWIIIPIILASLFPVCASVAMAYKTFIGEEESRVMVHDMDLMFLRGKEYQTPYFQIIYAYNFIQCLTLAPNFIGFDGTFCISTTHLSLKLKLFVLKLRNAFNNAINDFELEEMVRDALKDHQEAYDFYETIQKMYGGWLFVAFFLTSTVVSFNLYQLSLSGGADPKYFVFALCAVVHVFAPCYFASKLTTVSYLLSSAGVAKKQLLQFD